jgi:4,5-dihydroxyphthalate decarboxylase
VTAPSESPRNRRGVALKAVSRTQGNNEALKERVINPLTCRLEFEEVPLLIEAFRRMVRGLEFDVCEMALTTYICARVHGKRFTALPIFLVRAFHHGAIMYNTKVGVRSPTDLEGRRVGVNRGYTVTAGVWARAVLQHQYGVDLSKVTWVLSGDEHVAEYRHPDNVVPIEPGRKMSDLLADGELAAAIGVDVVHPDVRPLLSDPTQAAFDALRRDGHYPINHLIVVRDDVLEAHPGLAADLFDAFARSKRLYVDRLAKNAIERPTAVDEMHRRVMDITGADPLPYGIEPNRRTLENLMQYILEQKIVERALPIEELFHPETRRLVG